MSARTVLGKLFLGGSVLMIGAMLSGCGGGGAWPDLSKVQRPEGSEQPADLGDQPGDPSPQLTESASPEIAARLQELDQNLATADRGVETAYREYLSDLDQFLRSGANAHWATAQASLSRMGIEIDRLRIERDAVATYGLELGRQQLVPLAVDQSVNAAAGLHDRRHAQHQLEMNRLSVLTPRAMGNPGPAAVFDSTRTALATVRFAPVPDDIAPTLSSTVESLKRTVPDVAFDLIATGPAGTLAQQQAALIRVMSELRKLDVTAAQMTIALAADGTAAAEPVGDAVTVRIYIKKAS